MRTRLPDGIAQVHAAAAHKRVRRLIPQALAIAPGDPAKRDRLLENGNGTTDNGDSAHTRWVLLRENPALCIAYIAGNGSWSRRRRRSRRRRSVIWAREICLRNLPGEPTSACGKCRVMDLVIANA